MADPLEAPVKQYDLIEIKNDIAFIKNHLAQEDKGKTWFNRSILVAVMMSLGQIAALTIFYLLFKKSSP